MNRCHQVSIPLAIVLASLATLTAASMAAVAAWDRGGTWEDKALLIALSVSIVAAVHLLPAISRRPAMWLLWAGCLLGTMYGHLTFFTHASLRAASERASHTARAEGTAKQINAAQDALSAITARPVAEVAAQLASTGGWRERSALRAELTEAKRAATLRDELVRLQGMETEAEATGEMDPVISRLAAVTSSTEASISLAVGLGFSLLLELVGALLWWEALRKPEVAAGIANTQTITEPKPDEFADMRAAIDAGTLKPTVSGIRVYLGCSQARAMEVRRALYG